ncbi:DUF1761 domain-containing protein [Marinicella litoralis]|uniref:Uncharacterized protein DUF1761 n=1 Tax=Marinicella litoralis TaxID=644220 RepID=A0A4R6XT77_9GAMM|nr:DUF1761 domain-containing protein [Marinicella litoralis]TDR19568.1 uncharacterized protein DUF1761 [Marinicella litoralis]
MHIHFDLQQLNWLAVLIATAAAFILGGIWYGPLFSKPWMKAFGLSSDEVNQRHPGKVFGMAIMWTSVAAIMLALFIEPDADFHLGAMTGFFIGIGCITPFMGIHYAFEGRDWKILAINAGYSTLALTLMGAILGWF